MTVCIAALCQESSGVVLAADRMITSGLAIQFEHPLSRKATLLSKNCLALTAGNALAFTELFNDVKRKTHNRRFTAVEEYVEVLKASYQELRKKGVTEQILRPRAFESFEEFYAHGHGRIPEPVVFNIVSQIEQYDYGLELLVGGITFGDAHIYAIADPGTSQCFDSIGFHVIGSGTNLALSSLMGSRCHSDLPLPEVLMRVMDAKFTAENAPGVGRHTDIFAILPGGVAHVANRKMSTMRDLCKKWKNGDGASLEAAAAVLMGSIKKTGMDANDEPNTIVEEGKIDDKGPTTNPTEGAKHAPGVPSGDEPADADCAGEGRAIGEGLPI